MRSPVRNMVQCALFAALMTVCAWICIPIGDTVLSLQTLAVFLCLGLLGGRRGSAAIVIYLLLGAVGMPVFSGFRGGISVLAGATGGYLWGFLAAALIYRLLEGFGRLPAMIAGQLLCYACGCFWFYLYTGGGLWLILLRCVLPYLIGDGVKIALAYILTRRLEQYIT